MSMSEITRAVATLLETLFGITEADGSAEHAEYVLSIPDEDDVREWLTDALGLDESYESKISEFLSNLARIKEEQSSNPVRPRKPARVDSKPASAAPRTVSQSMPSPVIEYSQPAPVAAPKVRKPVPAARTTMREKCYCLAKAELGGHDLIGNCLACGRIVCDAEDYGDCLTCGAEKTSIHWLEVGGADASEAAVAHKDRLVQFDREGARRTRIYDDSTDWFAEGHDVWKGREEREEALRLAREFEEKKRQARAEMKVEIDFATGQIRVKDKAEAIQAVEESRDAQLADWIEQSNKSRAVVGAPDEGPENPLDADSEEILAILRQKLGHSHPSEHVSLFSFLDDDLNEALASL